MTGQTPEIKHLPSGSLPEGAPKAELCGAQHTEAFAVGDETAVFVVEQRERETAITQPWLSAQDDDLARQLVETIRSLYLRPGKPVTIEVVAAQPALDSALRGAVVAGQLMTKPVDRDAVPPLAEGIRYRDMESEEVASFLVATKDEFARAILDNSAGPPDWEVAMTKASRAFEVVLPEGAKTPGHSFLVVEDDERGRVAVLWVALREETRQSFCYNIEVEAGKRRMGFGRKVMAVWERRAAEQGAASIGLNVFGKNLTAQRLYAGAGLTVETTLFRIEE